MENARKSFSFIHEAGQAEHFYDAVFFRDTALDPKVFQILFGTHIRVKMRGFNQRADPCVVCPVFGTEQKNLSVCGAGDAPYELKERGFAGAVFSYKAKNVAFVP